MEKGTDQTEEIIRKLPRKLYSYRVMWTGVTNYDLFHEQELICGASSCCMPGLVMSFNSASGKSWNYNGNTIYTGSKKIDATKTYHTITIRTQRSHKTAFQIVKKSEHSYVLKQRKLLFFHDILEIKFEDGCYLFYHNEDNIAMARKANSSGITKPEELPDEAELFYEIRTIENVPADELAVIHVFPRLSW